jgi:hypothetical protein
MRPRDGLLPGHVGLQLRLWVTDEFAADVHDHLVEGAGELWGRLRTRGPAKNGTDWVFPRVEWSLLLLYQSTQPAVAYSTSAMVFYRPSWKTT